MDLSLFPPPSRLLLSRFLSPTFSSFLSISLFLALFSLFPFSFHSRFLFLYLPFVCLSLQLGNCPGYFHGNATIALTCIAPLRGCKSAQWVIFHTLFVKMWRSNSAEGLNMGLVMRYYPTRL